MKVYTLLLVEVGLNGVVPSLKVGVAELGFTVMTTVPVCVSVTVLLSATPVAMVVVTVPSL